MVPLPTLCPFPLYGIRAFFLDLTGGATFLIDEEASVSGASATAFCTGVVIFNEEAFEERKSLSTLLIMELV